MTTLKLYDHLNRLWKSRPLPDAAAFSILMKLHIINPLKHGYMKKNGKQLEIKFIPKNLRLVETYYVSSTGLKSHTPSIRLENYPMTKVMLYDDKGKTIIIKQIISLWQLPNN